MRKQIVFIGSHLGYPMDKTPLGGGAMVGLQLVRHWPQGDGVDTTVLGSGPQAPHPGVDYVGLGMDGRQKSRGLVSLSELEYARFCRRFEQTSTDWLLARRQRFKPGKTCVIVNDISEGPTLMRLTASGYPVISLWHVDVVDYFNKLYLKNLIPIDRLTWLYERARPLGRRLIPDLLRLIFEKQRETVLRSRRMVFPSKMMARTVERCYGGVLPEGELSRRAVVVPWGMWAEEPGVQAGKACLRDHFQISPDTLVLMTLSRISPEKGLHFLLKALRLLELDGKFARRDICLFLCGEPAFMQGAAYWRQVQAEAASLRKIRVFFPGYLGAGEKRRFLELAHLFISPSVHESYGLNIVEAMQAGKAILASDHYGVQDLLRDDFGRVVRYGDLAHAPRRLCEALKSLLGDPAELAAMGRRAKAAARAMPFERAAGKIMETALGALHEG